MRAEVRGRSEGRKGWHTAAGAYAPDGVYGEHEKGSDRTMKINYSEEARAVQAHPWIQKHPETGEETLAGCLGYIVGIEGMDDEEAQALLGEIYMWQTRDEFQYTHKWQENMFVIWDNRSVLHKANGGYDGYDRELHRTTVHFDPKCQLA